MYSVVSVVYLFHSNRILVRAKKNQDMSPKARIREELKRAVSKHKARPGGGGGLEETPGWISTGEFVEKWCSFDGETIGSMSCGMNGM